MIGEILHILRVLNSTCFGHLYALKIDDQNVEQTVLAANLDSTDPGHIQ